MRYGLRLNVLGTGLCAALAMSAAACDGSGLEPSQTVDATDTADTNAPDDTAADTTAPEEVAPVDHTTFDAAVSLDPVAPSLRPLPSGTSEATSLVVAKDALKGRFLFGMGADPDGIVSSLGGGAAGLAPVRVKLLLVAAERETAGTLEIRALASTGNPIMNVRGLLESYRYEEVDADTVRIDFSKTDSEMELAGYGDCNMVRSAYALDGTPVFADGLMTWPTRETYTRTGQCQWLPRSAQGLHVHYLRSDLAGRDFVPRSLAADSPFGYFLAGDDDSTTLARMPGIAADEPAITHTYYLVDFPPLMVPAAVETFEAWNDALEEITGRRPFAVEIAPAGMIAWDPRYHTVLWSKTGDGGAVAPFTNDPDTGEIFQSLVVMWLGDIGDLVTTYKDFLGEHPDVGDKLLPTPTPTPGTLPADAHFAGFDRRAATTLSALPEAYQKASIARAVRSSALAPRVLAARPFVRRPLGPHDVREAVSRDYTEDELERVIVVDFLLHELGHNLGLRHNFIGSVDKHRHSEAHTSSTTMDYVIGMLDPGSYDRDAMRYGYGSERPKSDNYLYCTDETMDLEPACIQWDYGNPVRYQLDFIDAYFAAYPPETTAGDIDDAMQWLDPELNRARSFVNSEYEHWDEPGVATLDELLAKVTCDSARTTEGEPATCNVHPALRSALALYLLYSRHQVTAWWQPGYPDIYLDYPTFTATQAATLMDTYYGLVTNRDEPLDLRTTIVGKLPTSAVSGAVELLTSLHEHFAALPVVTGDEATLKAAVDSAFAEL